MLYRDQECKRCHGTGVVKPQKKIVTDVEVVCSCPVGKMVATNVVLRVRRLEKVYG